MVEGFLVDFHSDGLELLNFLKEHGQWSCSGGYLYLLNSKFSFSTEQDYPLPLLHLVGSSHDAGSVSDVQDSASLVDHLESLEF